MTLNSVEQEVVFLKAVIDQINGMMNYEMMSLVGRDPDCNIVFHTQSHQRLFNILLVDFLSAAAKDGPTKPLPYLGALRAIVAQPSFAIEGSGDELRLATHEFVDWLETDVEIEVWLPPVEQGAVITIERRRFLKMCGNLAKHNFLRSVRVAGQLRESLKENGVSCSLEDALLSLPGFYERFHADILNYHCSTIAEFLNNIRWAIHEYLVPKFRESYVPEGGGPPRWSYKVPKEIESPLARSHYWDIMNSTIDDPWVPRFRVSRFLKTRY